MSEELRPLVSIWSSKLKLAWDYKKDHFQDDADEALKFFHGPYDFLYGRGTGNTKSFSWSGGDEDMSPGFRMTVNKVAELVQLFGPALYHRNPVRKVNPRKAPLLPIQMMGNPMDPNVQMQYMQLAQQQAQQEITDQGRSILLEAYLNYTPNALDLKLESRQAIDEALIKGLGTLWTELYHPAGGGSPLVGSFYHTVDDLVVDPDAESLAQAKWIARRCIKPHWEVERIYQLQPDALRERATLESFGQQTVVTNDMDGDYRRKQGKTNDLIVYWEIWSKMGAGGYLTGILESLRQPLTQFGDYCYLVVCEQHPYPLNIPQQLADALMGEDPNLSMQAVQQITPLLQWPTPYWADDGWPVTKVEFHQVPRRVWPMSHIAPAMGELKFLNWAFSFLAGKVKTSCRDFIAIAKSSGEELKERIKHGPDYSVIEIDALHESIDKMVQFLQHPEFNPEIYKVIEGVTTNFERRTGLTELAYGLTDTQIRSAQEAQVKGQAVNVRPDDMAMKVEEAMTELARKEALAARWHLKGQDVALVLGPMGAAWWDQLLTPSDPAEVMHQLEYRIEAGSAKKPNKALDQANMQQAIQNLFAPLFQYASATGNVGPVNALIAAWAKSIDLDATPFLLPQPPPPPAAPAGPGEPPGQPGPSANGAPPAPPAFGPQGPGPAGPPVSQGPPVEPVPQINQGGMSNAAYS